MRKGVFLKWRYGKESVDSEEELLIMMCNL